ncbi:MAG: hypothetical protein ABIP02_06265, partial [Arenimonas sp.]
MKKYLLYTTFFTICISANHASANIEKFQQKLPVAKTTRNADDKNTLDLQAERDAALKGSAK